MLEGLHACRIDTACIKIVNAATDEYAAILDGGELVIAAADMRAIESLTVGDLAAFWSHGTPPWIFADANLPPAVLRDILKRRATGTFRLALDAVSAPKAAQLPARLDGLDILFLNVSEARAYLRSSDAAEELALALLSRGAGAAVVTCGADGVVCADETRVERIPARPVNVVSATGAGDALAAGTLWRLLAGESLIDAVRTGCELAALTVETEGSVRADLSAALLPAGARVRS